MKKILFILALILSGPLLSSAAVSIFNSNQIATSTPTAGFVIVSNGANTPGVWTATSSLGISASPAGSNGQIQFNNSGAFGATTTLFWDNSLGVLGVGTSNPTAVNANAKITAAGKGSQDFIASTTDDTTTSDAIFNAYAVGSRIFMGAHGASQVSSRYGLTLGGYGEITALNSSSGTSKGLILGTFNSAPIVIGTNNVEVARFLSSGFLGIGTTTPLSLFTVSGTTSATTLTTYQTTSNVSIANRDQTANNFSSLDFRTQNSSSSEVSTSMITGIHTSHTGGLESGAIAFHTNNSGSFAERMRLTAPGRLGIGTTTPAQFLDVYGGAIFGTSSTPWLLADSLTGNVGIGSSTPKAKLSIIGDAGSGSTAAPNVFQGTGGTGGASSAGGGFYFNGGAGGTGGTGGLVVLVAGNGGVGAAGGSSNVTGGVGNAAVGGAVNITGGAAGTSNIGGAVNLLGGTGSSNAIGGNINLTGGTGGSTSANGGNIALLGGAAGGSSGANGGNITIKGGAGTSNGGAGGSGGTVSVFGGTGGAGGSAGPGGNLFLYGGSPSSGTTLFGNTILGLTSGAVVQGNIGVGSSTPAEAYLAVTGKPGTLAPFDVASSTNTSFLRILSSGAMGINDTTPDYKIEVVGSITNGYFGLTNTTDGDILSVLSNGNIGIGSTTPNAKLVVQPGVGTATSSAFIVASSTSASAASNVFSVNAAGHITTGGGTPVVSSCGVIPTISGNDTAGTVTVGTGVVTACTITFSVQRVNTPRVVGVVTGGALNITGGYSAKSTTAVTFSFAATVGSGTFDYYIVE